MMSAKIQIFLSKSFDPKDDDVNNLVEALCKGLDLTAVNVSSGSSRTPPNDALDKIKVSQAVIAICTKRKELLDGTFAMPDAVHQEIAMAFGMEKPILIIREDGLSAEGFMQNFSTYLPFSRSDLTKPVFIEKLVRDIHTIKLQVLGSHQILNETGQSDAYAEYVHHQVELKEVGQILEWEYSTTKKLIFTKENKLGYHSGAWAVVPHSDSKNSPPIDYSYRLINSSPNITLVDEILEETSSVLNSVLKPSPAAQPGDFVEYWQRYQSPYLNPIWLDQVASTNMIHFLGGDWACADGLVFVHPTKSGIIEFRFPRDYRIIQSQVRPFAANYTTQLDTELPIELQRCKITKQAFGEKYIVRIEIDHPRLGCMYGIAWNPPARPSKLSP